MKRMFIGVVLLLAAALVARADKVYLKDGRSFEGKVVEETEDAIKLKMSKGTIPIKKADIDRIEQGTSPAEELETMLEALTPSNAQGYVEAAEFCAARGVGDGPTVERLANIAISLDPATCGRAQAAIGDWYSSKGNRARAAEAYQAAFTCDWKNPSLRDKYLKYRDTLVDQKKAQLRRLSESLQLTIDNRLADALPGLQASANAPGASLISTYAPGYANYAAFLADVRSRVPCKSCAGKLWLKCFACDGEGSFKCTVCDGKGFKETKKNGQVVDRKDCGTCNKRGKVSCQKCKDTPGRVKCPTCKGVSPKPLAVWDKRGLTAFRAAIDERLVGAVPADEQLGPKLARLGSTTYDEAFTEDGKLVYANGKWVKPEEKK